jgi:hypothetical protein
MSSKWSTSGSTSTAGGLGAVAFNAERSAGRLLGGRRSVFTLLQDLPEKPSRSDPPLVLFRLIGRLYG